MRIWMVLIPFLAFALAFGIGAIAIWFIAKRSRISQTETTAGTTLRVESPIGTLDVRPEAKLDPRLAAIPIYPGALPLNAGSAETISEVKFAGKTLREISASYWTPEDAGKVWEFYRQQLPDWLRNLDGAHDGKELIRPQPDCVLLVRVVARDGRTLIETSIKPSGYPEPFARG